MTTKHHSQFIDIVDVPRQKIDKTNTEIKKASLFSHYIWTHDIHAVEIPEKKFGIGESNIEENKLVNSKSQGVLNERNHTTSNLRKNDHKDEENNFKERNRIKKSTIVKNNSVEKLSSNMEQVDKLISEKKSDNFILRKIEEINNEAKFKRNNDINKYQALYYELFNMKQELPQITTRRNQEFVEKITKIQRELRPEAYKLPAFVGENSLKIGTRSKLPKVSEI